MQSARTSYCMLYAVQLYAVQLYAVPAVCCTRLYTVQLYTQIPLSYGKGTPCYAVYCMLYAVYCMLYTVCCMLYAVLFTKIMQLPEFMHLRAFLVCVFTVRAANVWGLGMGRARGLK